MTPMKAKLVSWISPPRKPSDRGSSFSLGADPALQELRPPPELPDPPDNSLAIVSSVSWLLLYFSQSVSTSNLRFVLLDLVWHPDRGLYDFALDYLSSVGTCLVCVTINKVGFYSSSSLSLSSERFGMFFECEAPTLFYLSISGSCGFFRHCATLSYCNMQSLFRRLFGTFNLGHVRSMLSAI